MRIFSFLFSHFSSSLSSFLPAFPPPSSLSLLPLSFYFLPLPPFLLLFSVVPRKFMVAVKIEQYHMNAFSSASYAKWAQQSHTAIPAAPENDWFRIRQPNYLGGCTVQSSTEKSTSCCMRDSLPQHSVCAFTSRILEYRQNILKQRRVKQKLRLPCDLTGAVRHRGTQVQNCLTTAERTANFPIPPKHQINFHTSGT